MGLHTSWQQDSGETLNETLDRLIQQTNLVEYSEKNATNFHITKNNSKIFYVNPPESNKKSEKGEIQTKVTNIKTGNNNLANIADILHALGLGDSISADNADHNVVKNKVIKEITLTVEEHTKPQKTNTDSGDVNELSEDLISRGGRPAQLEDIPKDAILTFAPETDNNLLNKYPEIIIETITYHNANDKKEPETLNKTKAFEIEEQQESETTVHENNYPLAVAQEFKSLLEELQKMKADTANEMKLLPSDDILNKPQNQRSYDATEPCGNVLMLLCDSVLLNKLPEYQNLHGIISRADDLQSDTSLQLNRWGVLIARQNELMRISRAQKWKHVHFVPELTNNVMSRFVYRPFYGYY